MFKRLILSILLLSAALWCQCTGNTDPRVWSGTYDGTATYALCNVVYNPTNSSSYMSIQSANTGHQPDISSTYWTLVYNTPVILQSSTPVKGLYVPLDYNLAWLRANATTGPQGIQGIPGNTGGQGIQGIQGIQGVAGTGASYAGTSTTSLTVGTGSKSFTTQSGLAYTTGARVRASSGGVYMEGVVTSYSSTTLVVTIDNIGGSGTWSSWNLNIAGDVGSSALGDMLKANNLSDLISMPTARTNLGLGGAALLNIGVIAGTVAAGDDGRFTDSRTPTTHATTHKNGGSDEVATATPGANNIPKAGSGGKLSIGWLASGTPNGSQFIRDDGTLAVPPGSGSSTVVMTSGSSDPVANCTAPSTSNFALYVQTTTQDIWGCVATNLWKKILSTTNLGPYTLSSVAGPLSGGTAAARGSCSTQGYYLATDTHALTSCDGTNWSSTLNPSGSYGCIFNLTASLTQCYDSTGTVVSGGGGVDLASAQTLVNKTVDGVTPTVMGYVDPTSSVQAQLNAKAPSSAATTINGVAFCTGFTPTNNQLLQYTTGGSPNPCYTAATVSGGGGGGTPGGSSGQAQFNASGAFAGQSSIFSGGALVQRAVECTHGTVPYTTVAALGAVTSGEITIQTGISGNVVYDQILVNASTPFTFSSGTSPTVSMGRPGATTDYEMTGALVPIDSTVQWTARPAPPQLGTTYSVVLNFAMTTGNVNALTAGACDWRICGYAAQ